MIEIINVSVYEILKDKLTLTNKQNEKETISLKELQLVLGQWPGRVKPDWRHPTVVSDHITGKIQNTKCNKRHIHHGAQSHELH